MDKRIGDPECDFCIHSQSRLADHSNFVASRESDIDRIIAWLTIALGLGVLIPRAGFGLYALLEAEGMRLVWAIMLLGSGLVLVAISTLPWRRTRIFMLSMITVVWILLAAKFAQADLWGATAQAAVVIWFSTNTALRLLRMGK